MNFAASHLLGPTSRSAVATRLTRGSPQALLATRRAVHYNLRHGWDEMVRFEEELCEQVFNHPDAHEGMAAFL